MKLTTARVDQLRQDGYNIQTYDITYGPSNTSDPGSDPMTAVQANYGQMILTADVPDIIGNNITARYYYSTDYGFSSVMFNISLPISSLDVGDAVNGRRLLQSTNSSVCSTFADVVAEACILISVPSGSEMPSNRGMYFKSFFTQSLTAFRAGQFQAVATAGVVDGSEADAFLTGGFSNAAAAYSAIIEGCNVYSLAGIGVRLADLHPCNEYSGNCGGPLLCQQACPITFWPWWY